MTLAYQSFEIQAGQDVDLPFTCTDSNGAALDFAGASARFAMARDESSSPVLDSDASPGPTVTLSTASPLDGLLTVSIADTHLDALDGDYVYEVKVTDSSGNESLVAHGVISVAKALT